MRLADIDAIIADVEETIENSGCVNHEKEIIDCVLYAKTIDAVPVVHCKDCQYYQDNNGGYPHEECRWGHEETPDADDYCSYGAKMNADDVSNE